MNKIPDGYFYLGYLSEAHGILGEVKFFIDADNPNKYSKKKQLHLLLPDQTILTKKVAGMRWQKNNCYILAFLDIKDRTQAEKLAGITVLLPIEDLPVLTEQNQFYYHEIIGKNLIDKNLGLVGVVKEVREMPAQDLIVFEKDNKEVLVPIVDSIVLGYDRTSHEVFLDLPEGLIDIYLE